MVSNKKSVRPFVSILMLFGFITIVITGFMSFGLRYNSFLSAVHTLFGLTFVVFGVFHLKNNLKPIFNYFSQAEGKRAVWLSALLIPITIIGVLASLPPFKTIIDVGYVLKELKPIDRQISETIYTQLGQQGKNLSIDIKAGKSYSGPGAKILGVTITSIPQMAIWVEDINGNYIETLYVTKKASDSSYFDSIFSSESRRRPEALPHWSFSRGIISNDGLMMPSAAYPVIDAITGATPTSSFDLRTTAKTYQNEIVIKFEVNRSFDFNDTYHKDAFPNDAIYSGSGSSAQPSLIYASIINFNENERYHFMKLLGRGHHSGRDGKIYQNLKGITTAKNIVDRIIVEIL